MLATMIDKCQSIKEMMKRENDQKIKDNNLKLGKAKTTVVQRSMTEFIKLKLDRQKKVGNKYQLSFQPST
jgi:ribosomal protein L44E